MYANYLSSNVSEKSLSWAWLVQIRKLRSFAAVAIRQKKKGGGGEEACFSHSEGFLSGISLVEESQVFGEKPTSPLREYFRGDLWLGFALKLATKQNLMEEMRCS